MIDALTSPGMAIDIRLSTQEPVQQLGARLAHILSGELSRMRADMAFASATGIAVHSAVADAESLRAQQSSLLGYQHISLTTQTALHSEAALRTSTEQAIRDEQNSSDGEQWFNAEENPSQHQSEAQDEAGENAHEDDEELEGSVSDNEYPALNGAHDSLVKALQDALTQFHAITLESDLNGTPIALVLQADYWLEHQAPASLRYSSKNTEPGNTDNLLVLCLGFDGDLAREQTVWGFVYQNAGCIGSAHGRWSFGVPAGSDDHWVVSLDEPGNAVSPMSCQCNQMGGSDEILSGLRICIADQVVLCNHWSWQIMDWSWH